MAKLSYKDSGVDIDAGEALVENIKGVVAKTNRPEVIGGLGGFGALCSIPAKYKEPILVSGTDGVGTKLRLAITLNKHDTVGIDLVAMCVNDLIVQGAEPLFFLDYYATGHLNVPNASEVIAGIGRGCEMAGCALIGGETAEMPGFYGDGEYDMAGFSVGVVDRKNMITGDDIKEGDVIIGIPSSGIHSNGYSLVRKLFFEKMGLTVDTEVEELGKTLGEALLTPTRIYADACAAVLPNYKVKGIVHVTGGGFYENVPRILPEGIAASFEIGSWEILPIFRYIQKCGNIEDKEMFSTFNMGVGMMMVVAAEDAQAVVESLQAAGENASIIGKTVASESDRVIIHGNI